MGAMVVHRYFAVHNMQMCSAFQFSTVLATSCNILSYIFRLVAAVLMGFMEVILWDGLVLLGNKSSLTPVHFLLDLFSIL